MLVLSKRWGKEEMQSIISRLTTLLLAVTLCLSPAHVVADNSVKPTLTTVSDGATAAQAQGPSTPAETGPSSADTDSIDQGVLASMRTLVHYGPPPDILGMSADGTLVLSCCQLLQIWEARTGNLIKTLRRTTAFAVAPSGQQIAFAADSENGSLEIRVYDVSKDEIVRVLPYTAIEDEIFRKFGSYSKPISQIRFSRDGKFLIVIGYGHGVQVWDLATAHLATNHLMDYLGDISTLSPDNKLLAFSEDKRIKVVDLSTDRVHLLEGHSAKVTSLLFTPTGQLLVSSSDDRTLRVWNIVDDKEILRSDLGQWERALTVSPDGKFLITATSTESFLRDGSTARLLTKLEGDAHEFSPDGRYLLAQGRNVMGSKGDSIEHYNIIGHELSRDGSRSIPLDDVSNVRDLFAFSSDGRFLVWADWDQNVYLVDLSRLTITELEKTLESPYAYTGAWGGLGGYAPVFRGRFSPKSDFLVYKGVGSKLTAVDLAADPIRKIEIGNSQGTRVYEFVDGRLYIFKEGGTDDRIAVLSGNPPQTEVLREFQGKFPLVMSHDSRIAAFQATDSKAVSVINVQEGNTIAKLPLEGRLLDIAVSPDGSYLLSRDSTREESMFADPGTGTVWRVSDSSKIAQFTTTHPIAFHPNGGYAAIKGFLFSDDIQLIALSTGETVASIKVPGRDVESIQYSPDGQYLISAGKHLRLWAVASRKGRYTAELRRTVEAGYHVAVRPPYIATAGSKEGIRILDYSTGRLLVTIFAFSRGTVFVTPEGFFSGTGDFKERVHFVKGKTTYEVEQLYEKFHRPDLVIKRLKGEGVSRSADGP